MRGEDQDQQTMLSCFASAGNGELPLLS